MSPSHTTLDLKYVVSMITTILFVSLIGINNNVSATLILQNQNQVENLKQEVDNIRNSFNSIKSDFNIIKQSLKNIFDIIIENQSSPGIYYELELPPLPSTNQSTMNQLD